MESRQKTPQELLTERLIILVPDMKGSVRPYDNNEHLVKNPVVRGDMLIDWQSDTIPECPSLEAINAVRQDQVDAMQEAKRKASRDETMRDNLAIKAGYRTEKRGNPSLSFSDYLDSLEAEVI